MLSPVQVVKGNTQMRRTAPAGPTETSASRILRIQSEARASRQASSGPTPPRA